jgi:hypothetical protein
MQSIPASRISERSSGKSDYIGAPADFLVEALERFVLRSLRQCAGGKTWAPTPVVES